MYTKIITSTEEFYNLKDAWEELQEKDYDVTYYNTFEVNKAWWDVYKKDEDMYLFVICVYNNKKIVGIAPFIIENSKKVIFSWKVLKFLGRGDYLGVIINREQNNEFTIIKEIFGKIEECKCKWDRMYLINIKHNSILAYFLLKNEEYNKYFKSLIECPYLYLNKYKNYDEYKKIHSSKQKNKHIKRLKNKLSKERGFNFKVINNKNDYNVYDIISEVHKKEQEFLITKKNKKERISIFNQKYYSEFINNIYINNGKILTFFLEDDKGEVLFYDTCYLYKRVLHDWNCALNPVAANYSLSRLMNFEIVRYLYENDIADVLDFGAGRYPWKFKLTRDFIYNYKFEMWNLESKKVRILSKIYNKCIQR